MVTIKVNPDGSVGCNMIYGSIILRKDHLVWSDGVFRPVETEIPYSSIISVSSSDGGGLFGGYARIQVNTAGRAYTITGTSGVKGYDDVADRIRKKIEESKRKAKEAAEEEAKRQAEAQAKIIAQTMVETEARIRREMEEKAKKEAEERARREAEEKAKREAEDKKSAASGSRSNAPVQPIAYFSVADEILKFKNLLDLGIISPEDFEKKKNELLNISFAAPVCDDEPEEENTETAQASNEVSVVEEKEPVAPEEPTMVERIYIKAVPNPSDMTRLNYTLSGVTGLLFGEVQRVLSSLPYDITDKIKGNTPIDKVKEMLEGAGAEIEIREESMNQH